MKNIIIICSLLIAAISLKGQSNYASAYIITNQNDTITGLIDFRTNKMNSKVCKFKVSEKEPEQTFRPGEIAGFRFIDHGKYYVSKKIEIEGKEKELFLEFLVKGIINLYYYPEGESEYYFFQDETGKMISVTKKADEEIELKEGSFALKADNKYKGILRYIFRDSKSVSEKADRVSFAQSSIIDLTVKYHADVCKTGEACIEFETKPDKQFMRIRFSAYTGLKILSYKYEDLPDAEANHYISPVIGAQVNFSVPRWQKSISFQIDASCSEMKGKYDWAKGATYNRVDAKALMLTGTVGGKYTYHKGRIRPLFEAGGGITGFINSSSTYYQEIASGISFPVQQITKEDTFLPINYMFGYYIGTGFDYYMKNNHFLLLRIGFDSYARVGDKMTAWQIKAGYSF